MLLYYPRCKGEISLLKTADSRRLLKSALWDYKQGNESFSLIFLLKYPKRSRDPPSLILLQWQPSHENFSLDWVIHLSKTSLHHFFLVINITFQLVIASSVPLLPVIQEITFTNLQAKSFVKKSQPRVWSSKHNGCASAIPSPNFYVLFFHIFQ